MNRRSFIARCAGLLGVGTAALAAKPEAEPEVSEKLELSPPTARALKKFEKYKSGGTFTAGNITATYTNGTVDPNSVDWTLGEADSDVAWKYVVSPKIEFTEHEVDLNAKTENGAVYVSQEPKRRPERRGLVIEPPAGMPIITGPIKVVTSRDVAIGEPLWATGATDANGLNVLIPDGLGLIVGIALENGAAGEVILAQCDPLNGYGTWLESST